MTGTLAFVLFFAPIAFGQTPPTEGQTQEQTQDQASRSAVQVTPGALRS